MIFYMGDKGNKKVASEKVKIIKKILQNRSINSVDLE
jgi:hypothetical protein